MVITSISVKFKLKKNNQMEGLAIYLILLTVSKYSPGFSTPMAR